MCHPYTQTVGWRGSPIQGGHGHCLLQALSLGALTVPLFLSSVHVRGHWASLGSTGSHGSWKIQILVRKVCLCVCVCVCVHEPEPPTLMAPEESKICSLVCLGSPISTDPPGKWGTSCSWVPQKADIAVSWTAAAPLQDYLSCHQHRNLEVIGNF